MILLVKLFQLAILLVVRGALALVLAPLNSPSADDSPSTTAMESDETPEQAPGLRPQVTADVDGLLEGLLHGGCP